MFIRFRDDSMSSFVVDYIEVMRFPGDGRRLYVVAGNTSQVLHYADKSVAAADMERAVSALEDGFILQDQMATVVSLADVVGIRSAPDEPCKFTVLTPAYATICKYPTAVAARKAREDLERALELLE